MTYLVDTASHTHLLRAGPQQQQGQPLAGPPGQPMPMPMMLGPGLQRPHFQPQHPQMGTWQLPRAVAGPRVPPNPAGFQTNPGPQVIGVTCYLCVGFP